MAVDRKDPRISINLLAKYADADAAERRRTLKDAKFPPAYKVIYYDQAGGAVTSFVTGGMVDDAGLLASATRLRNLTPNHDNEAHKNRNNAEAIEAFLDFHDRLRADGLTVSPGPNETPHLVISGVSISVRPDLLLAGQYKGQACSGAVKLFFSKTALSDYAASLLAHVVMRHHEEHCRPDGHTARHEHCQVIEVFAKKVHFAPKAVVRRQQALAATCQEIAAIWPTITEGE